VYDLPLALVFRNAILWHRGKSSVIRSIKELEIERSNKQLRWSFAGKLPDGSSIEASVDGAAPGVHELPYTRTDGSGTFPVSNASLTHAAVKLGQTEFLETETGAVLEMGGG
jgi:hypothetical protein